MHIQLPDLWRCRWIFKLSPQAPALDQSSEKNWIVIHPGENATAEHDGEVSGWKLGSPPGLIGAT